jgi:metal-sulfur cluster biosynthetic enzyme
MAKLPISRARCCSGARPGSALRDSCRSRHPAVGRHRRRRRRRRQGDADLFRLPGDARHRALRSRPRCASAGFETRIERVLSPAWTTDWIGEEAREKLREYGIAPPVEASGSIRSLFGETDVSRARAAARPTPRGSPNSARRLQGALPLRRPVSNPSTISSASEDLTDGRMSPQFHAFVAAVTPRDPGFRVHQPSPSPRTCATPSLPAGPAPDAAR